jgi:hypothetical protein
MIKTNQCRREKEFAPKVEKFDHGIEFHPKFGDITIGNYKRP